MDWNLLLMKAAAGLLTILIAVITYRHRRTSSDQPEATVSRGGYHGLERRTRPRSTGALYQRRDGSWAFR